MQAYFNIFKRVGLGDKTFITFASGGVFSKYSHEFQTLCDAGEDLIYLDEKSGLAVNKEVLNDEVLGDLKLNKENLVEKKAIEVGNIFTLGTRFSEPLELFVDNPDGTKTPVFMGSYGIGLGRVMGTVAEVFADEKGLNWPINIAPFEVHVLNLSVNDDECVEQAQKIYQILKENNIEVLLDDRDVSGGVKFVDSDLTGIPYKIVVGKKSLKLELGKVFYRKNKEILEDTEISINDLIEKIRNEKN
jgi:prolyl-tRNA synthetase